jgi:diguanylate cyclase (GGDEF)-like protein
VDLLPSTSDGATDLRSLLRLVGWTEADAANLPALRRAIATHIDGIVGAFYDRLEDFPHVVDLLDGPGARQRLEISQRGYLLALGDGLDEPGYREARLRIGGAHARVGVAPFWFLGALTTLTDLIGEAVVAVHGRDAALRLHATLVKILQIDGTLAVEAYHHATMAQQNVLLRELEDARRKLEEAARIDALTGVRSRQALHDNLGAEFERARRFGRPLTVLFVDVDHFKAINDQHGHAVGDTVLRHVAGTLAMSLRPADLIGRFGGEEFVVGLVECDAREAPEVAERVRRAVAERSLVCAGRRIAATVSIGLAVRDEASTLESLLDQADAAMYRAKRAGRNQVAVALTDVKAEAPAVVVA